MLIQLSAIRGQDRVIEGLRREVRAGRLHHAHFFIGPEGVGKRMVARALAASLNCANAVESELRDACGQCPSCRQYAAGQHPDHREISADGRFIKMEQVREVLAETRYRPYAGRWRMVVFDGADSLKEEAANALLKTLEEPGQGTLFVLISAQPHGVLDTIRSRSIPMRFSPLPRSVVRELIADRGTDGAVLDAAAAMAGGSVAAAIGALESPFFSTRRERVERLLETVNGSESLALDLAEVLAKTKDELRPTLSLYVEFFRDTAMLVAGADADRLLHPDLADLAGPLARRSEAELLWRAIARAEEAQRNLLGNVHATLATEGFLFDTIALLRAGVRRRTSAAQSGLS